MSPSQSSSPAASRPSDTRVFCQARLPVMVPGRQNQSVQSRRACRQACILLLPLLLAAMVGVSRVDDCWHHWQDVFTGGMLGSNFFCCDTWNLGSFSLRLGKVEMVKSALGGHQIFDLYS